MLGPEVGRGNDGLTAATAMLPLPCSNPNRNTARSAVPSFRPTPQLKPSNAAAPLYPALPTPNSEEAENLALSSPYTTSPPANAPNSNSAKAQPPITAMVALKMNRSVRSVRMGLVEANNVLYLAFGEYRADRRAAQRRLRTRVLHPGQLDAAR